MKKRQQDGYTYDWETKRKISDDLTLDCNFHLDVFPAILKSEDRGSLLIYGTELYKLMEEIADRFEVIIIKKDKISKL